MKPPTSIDQVLAAVESVERLQAKMDSVLTLVQSLLVRVAALETHLPTGKT